MRNSIVKSKPFAVPQYPSARGYPTETLLASQVRRATGRAALVSLLLALGIVGTLSFFLGGDTRPVEGTVQCKAAQDQFERFEGSPTTSFDYKATMCRRSK